MSLIFLYLLFSLIILAALGVIFSKNSLFSILFLALVFILVSILFFIIGAEFLAILLLVIYSGALILLFLFIIFLLNLRSVELFNSFMFYLPIGIAIGCFFLINTYFLFLPEFTNLNWNIFVFNQETSIPNEESTNLSLFGFILYEHLGLFAIAISIILLAVMCGVIVLSSDLKSGKPKNFSEKDKGPLSSQSVSLWLKDGLSNSKKKKTK